MNSFLIHFLHLFCCIVFLLDAVHMQALNASPGRRKILESPALVTSPPIVAVEEDEEQDDTLDAEEVQKMILFLYMVHLSIV